MKISFFAMVVAALAAPSTVSAADNDTKPAPASTICIMPLLPASREQRGDAPPLMWARRPVLEVLPGMPSPLITFLDYPGRWLINSNRQLVPYDGFWPVQSNLDPGHQAREPWSSRTVAVTYGGGVSVLPPGSVHFEEIAGSHEINRNHGDFGGPFVLPHRKETVVTASDGSAYRVGEKTLTPWLSPQEMSRYNGAGVLHVYESRFLGGDVVLDKHGGLQILSDGNDWYEVVSLGEEDWGKVADAPKSGVAVFLGEYHPAVIAPKDGGGYVGWTLARNGGFTASLDFHVSELFGEAFYFGRSWFFDFRNPRWLRVTPKGYTEIEGSSRVVLSGTYLLDSFKYLSVHDLASIHRILFQGRDGFFLYDGNSIVPVPNSGPDVVGLYPKIVDMPSLGRSLVQGDDGIFEVTPGGRLEKIVVLRRVLHLQEWPQAHVGLVQTDDAIYSMNADLTLTMLALPSPSKGAKIITVFPPNTETGDVLISASTGLYLAVAGSKANDGACTGER